MKAFYELHPENVLSAVETLGFMVTGRVLALNSYENRVYEVELDPESKTPEADPLIAIVTNKVVVKFYRPGRWSRDQIREEHEFMRDLHASEVPAVVPIVDESGESLFTCAKTGILFTVFPKAGGRSPDEMDFDQIEVLARLLARLHNVGGSKKFQHRRSIDCKTYGWNALDVLLQGEWIPKIYATEYESTVKKILQTIEPLFSGVDLIRTHGDCHSGNILWNKSIGYFLDFDDASIAPPVQDFWMLFGGGGYATQATIEDFLEIYEELRPFNRRELKLCEPLRALRIIHYSSWIAKRYEDPAFKNAFPAFTSEKYWDEELRELHAIAGGF